MFRNLLFLTLGIMIVFISDPALAKNKTAKHLKDLSCAVNEIARFNGIEWQCSLDENTDTLGGLSCNANQIAEFNGSQWICADKAGGSTSSSNGGKFQFVGESTALFDGASGFIALSQACNATFPESRMCTSKEIMLTVNPPTPTDSWVIPFFVVGGSATESAKDFSGVGSTTSCSGWMKNTDSYTGLSINGGFVISHCNAQKRVACCAVKN